MRAVIASGTGRYADPWHPFDRTSPLVRQILEGAGFEVSIDEDVDGAMGSLDGIDLVVVNAGDPWRGQQVGDRAPADSVDGFARALERGIGVLALHCAVSSLRDYPEWPPAIGGMWVPGLSFHPPADLTTITGGVLPDGTPLPDFEVFDERYCRIQRLARFHVVAEHPGDREAEPTAWVIERGPSRIAVDLLGHDERSYESEGRRALLRSLAEWAVR